MSIQWKEYLTVDGNPLREATDEELDGLEITLGKTLPHDFREMIKKHQGQTPENLEVILPGGGKPGFTCILHASESDASLDSLEGYSIEFMTEMAEEELEHENVVTFAHSGNSHYVLDYNEDPSNPTVVFIDGDLLPDDKNSKAFLANSITDFLNKYEVK